MQQRPQRRLATLLDKLPDELTDEPGGRSCCSSMADDKVYNIVHLIYRSQELRRHSKDYEFSRLTMEDHWQRGLSRHGAHAAPSGSPASGRQLRTASSPSTSPSDGRE